MVGDAHHQRHVVLDQDHGDAEIGDLAQQRAEAHPCRRASGRRRARRAAALGARRPARARSRPAAGRHAAGRPRRVADRPGDSRRRPAAPRRDCAILRDSPRRDSGAPSWPRRSAISTLSSTLSVVEQLGGLIGARDAGTRDPPGGRAGQVLIAELHRAGIGAVEAADHVEHRGLAGAVRPDQAGDLAGLRVEAHAGRGADAAERDADIAHDKVARRLPASARPRTSTPPAAAVRGSTRRHSLRQRAEHAFRREPQHHQQQAPKNSSRYSARPRQHFGQHHADDRADQRAERPAGAADDDHQQEQDRLRERESSRARRTSAAARTSRPQARRSTADSAKAAVFTITGLRPIERAAISVSRTASMPSPQALLASRWKK